jgi:hypothetical protein
MCIACDEKREYLNNLIRSRNKRMILELGGTDSMGQDGPQFHAFLASVDHIQTTTGHFQQL